MNDEDKKAPGTIQAFFKRLFGIQEAEAAEASAGPVLVLKKDPKAARVPYYEKSQGGYSARVVDNNAAWQQLIDTPLAQDTVKSILSANLPDQAVQTFRVRTLPDDNLMAGEYLPKTREIALSGFWGAPNQQERRQTLLHEVGHEVLMNGSKDNSEDGADLFAGAVNALSGKPQLLRTAALSAIAETNRARADHITGNPDYDTKLDYDDKTLKRAESMIKRLLKASVYQDQPINRDTRNKPTKAETIHDILGALRK